jgi:hypothetical protein
VNSNEYRVLVSNLRTTIARLENLEHLLDVCAAEIAAQRELIETLVAERGRYLSDVAADVQREHFDRTTPPQCLLHPHLS